ncbi:MAG: hypothetical protein U5M50_16015 [Sphingobium sp.]|nr:hypothetical protein [Sphingobium sp.]
MRSLFLWVAAALASCAQAKPVDLSAPETWLGPEEAQSGRKLTFTDRTSMYIRTEKGCLLGKQFTIRGARDWTNFDPAWADLESLFNGSWSTDDPPPGGPIIGNLILDPDYYGAIKPYTRAQVDHISLECRHENGMLPTELLDTLKISPSNVRFYIHSDRYHPAFDSKDYAGLEIRRFDLERGGKRYCTIRLGVSGNAIKRARIDVLTSAHITPTFDDVEAIDCIARGAHAAFGYLGILRYNFDELYNPENLPRPGKPNAKYISLLLNGFDTYVVEHRIRKQAH